MTYENGEMMTDGSVAGKILDSAIEIINREGYENLTIRRVAKESGCSNSAIYQQFKDKNALAGAVAALQAKPFLSIMDDAYVKEAAFCVNFEKITGKLLEKLYSFEPEEIHMQVVYHGNLGLSENPFVLQIEKYLKNAMARGEIEVKDTRETAFLLLASFWGLVQMLQGDRGCDVDEAKKLLQAQNRMLYRGICAAKDENLLWDRLRETGVEVDKALERMKGNKKAYKCFLKEYFEDPDFVSLEKEIRAGNARSAFEYAHGLKGIAANLGLDGVRNKLGILVEILRAGGVEGALETYYDVMEACSVVTMLL
ncbi:MAG: TetR/AcrR family transcriptional regulator [Lachnospiraceae bacterium]|nr:TetR/AcrR family transcriptional regulator [Lachnospiraceae bacterium]